MKRLRLGIVGIFGSILLFAPATPAHAWNPFDVCKEAEVCQNINPEKEQKLGPAGRVLKTAIDLLSMAGSVLAVFYIIISGFRMVMSSGDPKTISSARNAIIYALVGLVVIIFAYTIINFVLLKVFGT